MDRVPYIDAMSRPCEALVCRRLVNCIQKSALTASVHVSAATKRDVSGSKAGGAKAAVRAFQEKE